MGIQLNIALCGVPTVGKHKLAQAFAKESGIEFANVKMEQALQKQATIPFKDMLVLHDRLLLAAVSEYERARAKGQQFIAACTPINIGAHALLAAMTSEMTSQERRSLMIFMEKCKSVTQNYFSMLVLLQPQEPDAFSGLDVTQHDIQHEILNAILLGMVHQDYHNQPVVSLSRKILTLPERMTVMRQAVQKVGQDTQPVPLIASFADTHVPGTLH